VWSMDFMADQLAGGSRFRSLTVVDIDTRVCLAIKSGQKLKGEDAVRTLNRIKISRGAMPSCKTLALTILMTVNTSATTQEEPRVGEQNRQREVRQARQRPQRGLHPRPEADHLAVLIC
jgi:hypothetical protein